jgi:hypothetical protein
MSYAYNYSYLQNDIIYNLHMSSVNSYVSGVYQPLRDLIIDRHNSNSNYSSRITKVEERSYKMYLEYIGESSNYPSLFSLQASISNAESYFNEISQHYSSTQPSFDHFFPIAVRYTDNKNIWLIERPPFLANITYKNSRSNSLGKETNYSIWMPWTVMLLVTNPKASDYSASLFFNDGPITSLDDKAIPCFFPNMYSNGRMCLNQTSVMLQQHLAQVNSFDPATIYNFIINDYMSGGWNSDLGIQAFDRLLMFSETAKNARNVIVNGNYADKKNYPSSTTPSGRLSDKKYIPNFLNYFSKSTLEEITAMVSEAKNISSNRYYSTYSSLISEATSSSFSSHSFSQIFESNSSTAPIYVKYNIYLDPSVDSCLTNISYDSPATFFEESLGSALLNQVKQDLFSEISILSSNPKHSYYHLSTPDLYVDFEDNNFKTFTLDPSLHDQSYFVSKFNTLNNQVQTI